WSSDVCSSDLSTAAASTTAIRPTSRAPLPLAVSVTSALPATSGIYPRSRDHKHAEECPRSHRLGVHRVTARDRSRVLCPPDGVDTPPTPRAAGPRPGAPRRPPHVRPPRRTPPALAAAERAPARRPPDVPPPPRRPPALSAADRAPARDRAVSWRPRRPAHQRLAPPPDAPRPWPLRRVPRPRPGDRRHCLPRRPTP